MIFVTVGSQMPFDRLISAVDRWARDTGTPDVIAQIGATELRPTNVEHLERVAPSCFDQLCSDAELVIAHAGMGSILTALRHGTPIVVMPRRAALRETRNDHQVATALALSNQGRVSVAMDETELPGVLAALGSMSCAPVISDSASPELLAEVGEFVGTPVSRWRSALGR